MREDTPNKIPDPSVRQLIAEGWGTLIEFDDGNVKIGFHSLSVADMERMGEAERIRLGIESDYQFILAHRMDHSSKDDTAPASE